MTNPGPEDVRNALMKRIDTKAACLGVIGLGYVGLPICIAGVRSGLNVIGFDVDETKPDILMRGETYLRHIPAQSIRNTIDSGKFIATSDFSRLSEPDILLVCVPTPLSKHLEPDLSYIEKTAHNIAARIRKGQLIVLESTTYPGTTTEVMLPILLKSGLIVNHDFWIAYSPEREDPGNNEFSTSAIPKVVGANDSFALHAAAEVYKIFVSKVVPVSSSQVAEAVKLTENIFRSVNIALVNELKIIFDAMDIDIWEVIDAAKTKPFGYMPFYPGPGLGGHCIPIDPFYLTWKAREFGISTRFIELAGQINSGMPEYVINKLAIAIDHETGEGLTRARILVVGVAYKKNVDDMRESPALRIMELLRTRCATVDYYDPFVEIIPPNREHPELIGIRSQTWRPNIASFYTAVLIVTDHDDVNYNDIVSNAQLVIDTRNVCRAHGISADNVILA